VMGASKETLFQVLIFFAWRTVTYYTSVSESWKFKYSWVRQYVCQEAVTDISKQILLNENFHDLYYSQNIN
jgi:hypothetical protein